MAKCEHDRVRSTCSICKPELVYQAYERKAEQRNLSFRLTLVEFELLTSDSCHYCNDWPAMGIDRMDNRIGYLPTNSLACCSGCNFLKGRLSYHEFLDRVKKIAVFQEQKRKRELRPVVPAQASLSGEATVV